MTTEQRMPERPTQDMDGIEWHDAAWAYMDYCDATIATLSKQVAEQQREIKRLTDFLAEIQEENRQLTHAAGNEREEAHRNRRAKLTHARKKARRAAMKNQLLTEQVADLTAKLERARADVLEEAAKLCDRDAITAAGLDHTQATTVLHETAKRIRALSTDTTGGER